MFLKKLKNNLNAIHLSLNAALEAQMQQWKYINALLDAEKQNRKDLNTVIAKINQMKSKGKR